MDLSIKLKLDDSGLAGQAKAAADQVAGAAQQAVGGVQDLNAAVRQAQGGMGVLNGASAMASGSLQGMAGGAVQAANGMRMLGASMRTAMAATAMLAVLVALKEAMEAVWRAGERLQQIRLDNLAHWADGARANIDAMNKSLEMSIALANGLANARDNGRRIEQERRLAELERDRNRELASGGDADEVNKRYDAKRRELEFSFARDDAAQGMEALQSKRADNERRIALLQRQQDEAARIRENYENEKGLADEELANPLLMRIGRFALTGENDKTLNERSAQAGKAAAEQTAVIASLDQQITALQNENKILDERIAEESGRTAVIDLQEEAAALAASIPEKSKEEAGKAAKEPSDSWGSLQTASDRLARIGGFVGGSNMVQNQAREQLQVAKRELQVLEKIERNTSNGGQGAAILA